MCVLIIIVMVLSVCRRRLRRGAEALTTGKRRLLRRKRFLQMRRRIQNGACVVESATAEGNIKMLFLLASCGRKRIVSGATNAPMRLIGSASGKPSRPRLLGAPFNSITAFVNCPGLAYGELHR